MRTLSEINVESSEEEIVKFCQDVPMMALSAEMKQMFMDYGIGLLSQKQQQKLLIEQNKYNKSQLVWARVVAITAIVSIFVALGILKFNPETLNRNFSFFVATSSPK